MHLRDVRLEMVYGRANAEPRSVRDSEFAADHGRAEDGVEAVSTRSAEEFAEKKTSLSRSRYSVITSPSRFTSPDFMYREGSFGALIASGAFTSRDDRMIH